MTESSHRPSADSDSIDTWLARARRQRIRGEHRKALLTLREACNRHENDARVWTLYAVECWSMGRRDDGRAAMRQALWLRERDQDHRRAHVLRGLLLGMESALAHETVGGAQQQRRSRGRRRVSSVGLVIATPP